ncbi:MAG: hypothetical protein WB919_02525 [Candidatus Sulfotelmatobacter sp.]
MLPKLTLVFAAILCTVPAIGQQSPDAASTQPQVKVNVLNVCTPSAEEQKEIAAALARIPKQPLFASDFEISHGVSTLTDAPNFLQPGQGTQVSDEPSVARYVRIRREFAVQAMFSSVQYSFSNDGQNMVETLVLHVRDPKDLIQVSMEDSASAIGSVATMLTANTPASRIRLERFGKSSVALARCSASENGPAPDQTAYEPQFRGASDVLANYRRLLGVRHTVLGELAQIPSPASKSGAKQKSINSSGPKK